MNHPVIHFVRRGHVVELRDVPPTRTLLQVLREDLSLCATKEGCNEGDCGACTVVLAQAQGEQLHYRAVNSCLQLAHAVNGLALWTADDLADEAGTPHPVQQALVEQHASQCGFCTPGFVMSLFGMYQNRVLKGQPVTRELAQQDLSGNLCRCTGYRPILDAAQHMAKAPLQRVNEADVLSKLKLLALTPQGLEPDLSYNAPTRLGDLLALRRAHPTAQLVAGCTDVGLWINKLHRQFDRVLDVSRVTELTRITRHTDRLTVGAAVTLTDAFAALVAERPQLRPFATRFAGLPVRNAGTLGGNIANGSPIGDSMPLLIALGAQVVLASERGERTLALESLYTGYRQNVIAPDEVLAWIDVPHSAPNALMRVYKVSKRFDDDISAVCLALQLTLHDGHVVSARVGVGGVAATPVRARQTEAALTGQPWTPATVQQAMATLRGEFSPMSDLRASSTYRVQVLGQLLQRFWLESQGHSDVNLESFTLSGEPS